ncbi:MGAT2 [Cordylochernes scorpioides]|uniref:Alpha-1,6-mannosyl-glycoprotein 2-beta-N-acetylglucosaminyltransferase n=1 Tax=Cordylochernes scorpioides TaxID=51811 RepID=A0ABY6KT35_9ARAC|nr:MGAT2 [Cordylochernes scorpioides]
MNLSAINPNGSRSLPSSLPQLRHLVQEANSRQRVLNEELFPPLAPDDTVIVVQVHKRVHYLYALIESLRQAQNIENTLLIFSHDLYNSDINALVETIDFCKVMQIFYPNSIQLHPNEFPGEDPNDCPRDINKIEAAKLGCNNAAHPDLYGHYREASFTQTKHHWWWKGSQHVLFHQVNRVMDGLEVTHNHTGPVIFLEEDHYVSPDFLPFLAAMMDLRASGIHHKGKDCSSSAIIQRVFQTLEAAESHLFPSTLTLRQSFPRHFRLPKGNGGWGDIRDHQLCLRTLSPPPASQSVTDPIFSDGCCLQSCCTSLSPGDAKCLNEQLDVGWYVVE